MLLARKPKEKRILERYYYTEARRRARSIALCLLLCVGERRVLSATFQSRGGSTRGSASVERWRVPMTMAHSCSRRVAQGLSCLTKTLGSAGL